ncbi:hypothetical protein LX64_04184 [Chitinophaga skermanii]|uniref:Uncharacterized protein n=1 Tax=Chitinophaga skermanii TaxID=331697 RepID=A0A327Q9J3_9BACT|nr:hypothetical protein [Chitinophaga skermanii]RAJ00478.1 hypothetical protein LX64_04184 [Chitinophaga skermanii]
MNVLSDWKEAEYFVTQIEQAYAPDAVVKHNVMLPVIGEQRYRQCDVVIYIGKEPRATIFIVEVQKRGSKPDINTFNGWVEKMNEVGANGLICVSHVGFPESITSKVLNKIGPKVKLVTLRENAPNDIWADLHLVPEIVETSFEIDIKKFNRPVYFDDSFKGPITIKWNEPILSNTGKAEDAQPIGVAINNSLNANDPHQNLPPDAIGQLIEVNLNLEASDSTPLYIHANEGIIKIMSWLLTLNVRRIDKVKPITYSKWEYKQEFYEGALAWIATTEIYLGDIRNNVRLIFIPEDDHFRTIMQINQ